MVNISRLLQELGRLTSWTKEEVKAFETGLDEYGPDVHQLIEGLPYRNMCYYL